MKSDSSDELSLETFMSDSADNTQMLLKAFNNPKYVVAVKALLSFFDKRGYLDTLITRKEIDN